MRSRPASNLHAQVPTASFAHYSRFASLVGLGLVQRLEERNENRFASLAKRRRRSRRAQDRRWRRLAQGDRHVSRAQRQGARACVALRQDQGLSRGISSARRSNVERQALVIDLGDAAGSWGLGLDSQREGQNAWLER